MSNNMDSIEHLCHSNIYLNHYSKSELNISLTSNVVTKVLRKTIWLRASRALMDMSMLSWAIPLLWLYFTTSTERASFPSMDRICKQNQQAIN